MYKNYYVDFSAAVMWRHCVHIVNYFTSFNNKRHVKEKITLATEDIHDMSHFDS